MSVNTEKKITVLYIAGTGRNGSTLMERILNELPGFFAAGELGYVSFDHSPCMCHKKFNECPVWGKIVNDADFKKIEQDSVHQAVSQYLSNHIANQIKLLLFKQRPEDFKKVLSCVESWFKAIHHQSNAQVITDSTIYPLFGYCLSLMPSIDLHVVHLIKDPRSFVHSMNKAKYTSKNEVWSPRVPPLQSISSWMKRNIFIELIFSKYKGKYLRVHYEDFIEDPIRTLNEIGRLLNLKLENFEFIRGKKITFGECHLSCGNIDAFKKGEIILKVDERWKQEMNFGTKFLVTLMTWPLLLKYFLAKKLKRNRG